MNQRHAYFKKAVTDLRISGSLLMIAGGIFAGIESATMGGAVAATGAAMVAAAAWAAHTAKTAKPAPQDRETEAQHQAHGPAKTLRAQLEDLLDEENLKEIDIPEETRKSLRDVRVQLQQTAKKSR